MSALTQEDFVQGYTSLDTYPRIVVWATSEPLAYKEMQISVTVLQRQFSEGSPWEFIPSLKPSSSATSTSEDSYGDDPFVEDADVLLDPEPSFDDALDAVVDAANELIAEYY